MARSRPQTPPPAVRPRSSAPGLAIGLVALVVYASLYPFAGWSWPSGQAAESLLRLPLPPWRDPFDIWANGLGYGPVGGLICLAALRSGWRGWASWALGVLAPSALSYLMEVTQHFLPGRYPSLLDWGLNTVGGAAGASVAWVLHRLRLVDGWQRLRDRWFNRHSAGALLLLWAWPVALLFPLPFPYGVGVVWQRVQDALVGWLLDVSWAQEWLEWLSEMPTQQEPLPRLVETVGMALGLLAPCLVAHAVTRTPVRRMVLAVLLVGCGLVANALSAALNFGPGHAWSWVNEGVPLALAVAMVLALLAAWLPQRLSAGLGLVVLTALGGLVLQAPTDPYFAQSLQLWEQGRFIRFHGLAQWVGWFWPTLALLWLAARVGINRAD